MDELRPNDKIKLERIGSNSFTIEGIVSKIEYDRIFIKIPDEYQKEAEKLFELDEIFLSAQTLLGTKNMNGAIIERLNKYSKIIIENNPSIKTPQKRKYVRVVSSFDIKISKDNKEYNGKVINISAGGILFSVKENYFNQEDDIKVILPEEIFGKKLIIDSKIVKMNELNYAIKYDNLSEQDENRIMKFVFKIISDNKKSGS